MVEALGRTDPRAQLCATDRAVSVVVERSCLTVVEERDDGEAGPALEAGGPWAEPITASDAVKGSACVPDA